MEKVRQINRGCIRVKRSDRVLTAHIRHVIGWTASEEFCDKFHIMTSFTYEIQFYGCPYLFCFCFARLHLPAAGYYGRRN